MPTARHSSFPTLRLAGSLCAACLVFVLAAGAARAACPTGQISLFLPAPARSQIELLYSLLPAPWKRTYYSTLSLVLKPGRGGSHAAAALGGEKGDGCFLAAVQTPSFFFQAELTDGMYRENALAPPTLIARAANALWVDEDGPLASIDDIVLLARGSGLRAGRTPGITGVGSYTDQHLATLQFNRATGIPSLYLPSLGSREAREAVRAGKADACWGYATSRETMPGLRPLAVAGETRSPALPDVPTFRELGLELINAPCFGVTVLASASDRVRHELAAYLTALLDDPALKAQFLAHGFTPLAPEDSPVQLADERAAAFQALEDYSLIPRDLRRPPAPARVESEDKKPEGPRTFHPLHVAPRYP